MQPRLPTAFLASTLLAFLSGCAKPPVPVVEAPPPLPPHLGPPPAANCTVAPFHVADGGTATIAMTVSNDGGFCAASLVDGAGMPFDAPLVPTRPLHGDETVVKYNGKTSIEYAARSGYVGADSFVVRLIIRGQPGYTTLNVGVTVQPVGARTS